MQNIQPSPFARAHTFFGVCEAIGEDCGFNPVFLRLLFVPLLFFYPLAAIGAYLAAGAVVLISRLLFPVPRPATAQPAAEQPLEANDRADAQLPLAA